jgi:P27 family predicted phage terminase small subunit
MVDEYSFRFDETCRAFRREGSQVKYLEVPKHLDETNDIEEIGMWTFIINAVAETGRNRLQVADYHLVSMTVQYLLLHKKILAELADADLLVDTAQRNGSTDTTSKANPLLTQLDKVTTQCIKLMIQLGMTPKARKQLGVESDDEDDTDDEI